MVSIGRVLHDPMTQMLLLTTRQAHIPTNLNIVAAPSPIGLGHTYTSHAAYAHGAVTPGAATASTPTNGSTASAALLSNGYRFHNYNLTITKPDGTMSTQIFPVISDSTSSQYVTLTPDQIGTYTIVFRFPGQVYGENGNGYEKSPLMGDLYLSRTATTTLTVQQEPIPGAKTSGPLPSQYWARPIYGENTDWWAISSNWLGVASPPVGGWSISGGQAGMYHQDAIGPLTSDIMWTRPLQFGGAVGGNQFQPGGSDPNSDAYGVAYFEGSSYAPRFYYPIIIQGILFYTETASFTGSPLWAAAPQDQPLPLTCEQENNSGATNSYLNCHSATYTISGTLTNTGYIQRYLVAIVSGQWNLYDAATGLSLFNVTAVPGGTTVMGPSGEHLKYNLVNTGTAANPAYYLSEWNSSKLWLYDINPYTGGGSLSPSIINASNGALIQQLPLPVTGSTGTLPTGFSTPAPYGSTLIVNASIPITNETLGLTGKYAQAITTYDYNISMPWANILSPAPAIVAVNYGDMMLCRSGSLPTGFAATGTGTQQGPYTYLGVNLNASKGQIGNVMWTKTYTPPAGNVSVVSEPVDFKSRVFTFSYQETMQWVGYNLDTGEKIWGPTASQSAFDYYGNPGQPTLLGVAAYGNLYVSSFSGILYAYNIKTGDIVFTYGNGGEGNSTNAGFNVFYGAYPTQIQSISNGVVYTATNEHTVPNPIYKGSTFRAINATTGAEIWTLSGYASEWATAGTAWATADGYLTAMNGYDQQIYSIGRGPSKLTVTAPDLAAQSAQAVVIKGTVTDISAGTQQSQQAANYPNGMPLAADSIMTDWMAYVYQQQGFPTDFAGVPVTISVVDANGNYRTVGTATSTSAGTFSLTWTPDIPGDYTVVANFAGTNAYWPSSSMTSFNVAEAHPTVAPTAAPPATNTDTYVLASAAAIIVVIIIVGAVSILMQRKKP